MTTATDPDRRRLLHGLAAIGTASLAGCTALGRSRNQNAGSTPADQGSSEDSAESTPSGPLHWHVPLTIEIHGEPYTIPTDVGIGPEYSESPYYDGMQMTSIHTHDDTGKLHWELKEDPRDGELTSGAFFDIWGKQFSETCIFDYCTDEGELTMLVNGTPNDEFGDYHVRDGDEIVVQYN